MFKIRTDLALEARELLAQTEGIGQESRTVGNCQVDKVTVLNDQGAQAIGRPQGEYVTVTLLGGSESDFSKFHDTVHVIADEIRALLPDTLGEVMVAGLGNIMITPDALGPKVVSQIMVTRHIVQFGGEAMAALRPVSAVSPGVLGITGVETGEILQGVREKTGPRCIIAVDALASRRLDRLCRTIQIADTGIVPGSGIGNRRFAINRETMGVPVIAIGVPTVVDAATLAHDLVEDSGQEVDFEKLEKLETGLIVTPREIDAQISFVSKIVAYAINIALQKDIDVEDVDLFLS